MAKHVSKEPFTGRKDDAGKLRFSLLPWGALVEIVKVLEAGAKKYGDDNWKHVPDSTSRYFNAMMRHITSWWGGEICDPETKFHHLAHASCCALFLMWFDDVRDDMGQ